MKWLIIIVLGLLAAGCVSAQTPWGTYYRFGDQEISGAEIKIADPNGRVITLSFDKQKSEVRLMRDFLAMMKEAYLLGRKSAGAQ